MLRKIDKRHTRWGLTIKPSETEYLVVGYISDNLQLTKTQNKNSDDGRNTEETISRFGQVNSSKRQQNRTQWNNCITRTTKIKIHKMR